jgi:hypothetical protein
VLLNGHPTQRLPNALNVSFPGRIGEDILHSLPCGINWLRLPRRLNPPLTCSGSDADSAQHWLGCSPF